MEPRGITEKIKSAAELIPRQDIEKYVFKLLLLAWAVIMVVLFALRAVLGPRDYVKRKIIEAAETAQRFDVERTDIAAYESVFDRVKSPEPLEEYTLRIARDPFSKKTVKVKTETAVRREHDFEIRSINKIPLPLVYRGYIELPDRIIGQVNWHQSTEFVNIGSVLNGYRVKSVHKDRLLVTSGDGTQIEFRLNTPVLTDRLEAVLFDRVSKKTFNVTEDAKIGDYEVVDVSPDRVTMRINDKEMLLEKIKNDGDAI